MMKKTDETRQPKVERRRISISYDVYSFALFCAVNLVTIFVVAQAYYYFVFVLILVVDGLATLAGSDSVIAVDRSAYFLALVIVTVGNGRFDLFSLFLSLLLSIMAIDFSLFLRKLRRTVVDLSVIGTRLDSYVYTLGVAFLLSFSLTVVYSLVSGVVLFDPLTFLVLAATSALFAVFGISRYLSSRVRS